MAERYDDPEQAEAAFSDADDYYRARALEARIAELEGERDEARAEAEKWRKVAIIVDDTEGCCGPGEWCHFKTYTELAVDYVDDCERRYREGRAAAFSEVRERWGNTMSGHYSHFDPTGGAGAGCPACEDQGNFSRWLYENAQEHPDA